MGEYSHLVGRIAKLKNWPRGIGIDGARVSIHSWNVGTDTFDARLLETQEHVVAIFSQRELNTPDEFSRRYPNATTVKSSDIVAVWPTGVIIDLSDPELPNHADPQVIIRGSCRLNGKDVGSLNKRNVSLPVLIETANDDDIVEIEWLSFSPLTEDNATRVIFSRGNVVFRNCLFLGNAVGLVVGTLDTGNPNVTCETCQFAASRECGTIVNRGHLSIVECSFQQLGVGICVKDGAFLVAHHCSFDNQVGGVVCPNNASAVVYNCKFENMSSFGVHVGGASKVHIDRGDFRKCRECVRVVNLDLGQCTVAVVRTIMHECQVGVKVGYGSAKVKVVRCTIKDCNVGTFVAVDALGEVTIRDCDSVLVTHAHVDMSGKGCAVLRDGGPSNTESQQARLLRARSVVSATPALRVGVAHSTLFRRTMKETGIIEEMCFKCKAMEAKTEWFSKCAGCKEAYYCSRACQTEHWPAHKHYCKAAHLRRGYLISQGYICCVQCRALEADREKDPFRFDPRDMQHYYCSERCRREYYGEL